MGIEAAVGLGSLLHEILQSLSTIVESVSSTYDRIIEVRDKHAARRQMKALEVISERLSSCIFEEDGIRSRLSGYVQNPNSRPAWEQLQEALNHSQETYNDAVKSLKLGKSFKARHPELLEKLTTYTKQKGTIINGIGNQVSRPKSERELGELRELDNQFDLVNKGIREIRKEIGDSLLDFDQRGKSRKLKQIRNV